MHCCGFIKEETCLNLVLITVFFHYEIPLTYIQHQLFLLILAKYFSFFITYFSLAANKSFFLLGKDELMSCSIFMCL